MPSSTATTVSITTATPLPTNQPPRPSISFSNEPLNKAFITSSHLQQLSLSQSTSSPTPPVLSSPPSYSSHSKVPVPLLISLAVGLPILFIAMGCAFFVAWWNKKLKEEREIRRTNSSRTGRHAEIGRLNTVKSGHRKMDEMEKEYDFGWDVEKVTPGMDPRWR